jgi:uncharacterized membrane protein YukC
MQHNTTNQTSKGRHTLFALLTYCSIGIIVVLTFIAFYFSYQKIFVSIQFTNDDIFLNATQKIQPINFTQYEQMKHSLEERQLEKLPQKLFNPFTQKITLLP